MLDPVIYVVFIRIFYAKEFYTQNVRNWNLGHLIYHKSIFYLQVLDGIFVVVDLSHVGYMMYVALVNIDCTIIHHDQNARKPVFKGRCGKGMSIHCKNIAIWDLSATCDSE